MNIFPLNDLRQQAEHAAEQDMGSQSNPYLETDPAHKVWSDAFYARLHSLAVECAS
jgi:hypothetical protein